MTASILGKRSRAADTEGLPVRTASKRRTIAPRPSRDVAALPPKSLPGHDRPTEKPRVKAKAKAKLSSKHTLPEEPTIPTVQGASPTQIKSHFRTSKLVLVEEEKIIDEKPREEKEIKKDIDNTIKTESDIENEKPAPIEIEFKTPQKSRFRDALQQSPVTPRHRVQVGAKSSTPRTPRHSDLPPTPRPSATPSIAQSVYSQARQLFARGANSGRLVGRDAEREKVATFIGDCIKSQKGDCLYVSGPPGTGKSAMIGEVCQDIDLSSVKVSHVNCASMRNARDVYTRLVQDFGDQTDMFKKSEGDRLKAMFLPSKVEGLYLVSLDEMDHLLTGDSGVLQSLFEWSLHARSSLILIGIANALDLTDRSLPQLKAKNLKPNLLPFLPYNAASIANVITNKLRSLLPDGGESDPKFVPFLQPAAIQLCAKKVASQTGDLRKAFELIKRAIDAIEQETHSKLEKQAADAADASVLAENKNLSTSLKPTPAPRPPLMANYNSLTAPRASIAHVARITTSAFGQGTIQRLKGLNLQQKAAICSLIALERKRREFDIPSTPSKSRSGAPTVKQAFDTYCTLCRNDNILHPLTSTEFKDVLSNLETMGLVGDYQGRGRGGTLGGGSDVRRTPSKSGSVMSTPHKGMDEQGLLCFVSQSEIEGQIAGPGEGILRRLLRGDGL
ncbi:hypothetical protein N7509_007627 [Penicillium cosmopolitanum]|uniref:Cell division control protein n=1 Tax=Penicillium cosmopolitanum TaxID=1131564 RepID=A0A9X0B8K5_9EURO|nr:uncharacterized protein N7509_007627 [Penicillium cosmopolitanum]KAJ5392137.1 hypothetical protein N7509_007627 [Penicillium cosmopolitanum]